MDNAKGFTDKIKFNMSLFWAVVLSFVTAGAVEILWLIKFGNEANWNRERYAN